MKRGAQLNTHNRFSSTKNVTEHFEGIDELPEVNESTTFLIEHPKSVLSKNSSPDIPFTYSINPYQGCEHGCVYCYARNVHEYWGYSAGLDFEQKIIVKPDVASILKKQFQSKGYKPDSVSLSGNTDCYQPAERKYMLTRQLLQVFLDYNHPVGVITKNSLILRDLDIISALAEKNLIHVFISITSLDEKLRRLLEPRTVTTAGRLKTIETLSGAGVPVGVMTAPVIPGLNSNEIPSLLKAAADHGAMTAGYTIIRLNGAVKDIFYDWLRKTFPDSADKIWNQIRSCHGGKVNDSRSGVRMSGEGKVAESIKQLFNVSRSKYRLNQKLPKYDYSLFKVPGSVEQLSMKF